MEFLVGVALAVGIAVFTTAVGFDRDRSLYPTILIVIASYYTMFAVMGGGSALVPEVSLFLALAFVAALGFRTSLWIVVVALAGHGLLDFYHGGLIYNAGVPDWWPGFCLSIDLAIAAWLAWRLSSGKIEATNPSSFGRRIQADVETELEAARAAELAGDLAAGFRHLECAHILGQRSTRQHVRVHVRMLIWAVRHHNRRDVIGQIMRVIGAALGTWAGLVPDGNTGGSDVSGFQPMPIPAELAGRIAAAGKPAPARPPDEG